MNREGSKFTWEKKMGVDIARYGDDRSIIVIRQGEKVTRKETMQKEDLMFVTGKVLSIAKEEIIKPENIFVDVIGYGAGVVDRLKEQGWYVGAVNVAETAENNEKYANIRAEMYFKLKEWLKTASLPK